jgi:hypothetical protein
LLQADPRQFSGVPDELSSNAVFMIDLPLGSGMIDLQLPKPPR